MGVVECSKEKKIQTRARAAMLTASDLVSFELEVAERFNAGEIRAPVHLSAGNEEQLIEIFEDVRDEDWICCTWRSHLHCLLKGVPRDLLLQDILAGKSIALCYPEYRVLSSAIVGGALPIALGLAWSARRNDADYRVWAFLGDMAERTGIYHECVQYAAGHELPITFVVENNGKSVCTDTDEVWGRKRGARGLVRSYSYQLPFPHAGAGKRVQF